MIEWLACVEGTETSCRLALFLALTVALVRAVFGALQKGRHDPWLTRGATDNSYMAIAAPFARFVVPLPEPHMWPIFLSVWVIHTGYELLQAMADPRGAF
jgi:hypothetical protein